jgi:hypothetical protein
MTTIEDVIRAAASVGRDVAEGKLAPAALDAAVTDECRELFGAVVGPSDPLWPLHVDVARQVLALGGVPADELTEWRAVARSREPEASKAVTPSEPHQTGAGSDDPGEPVSPADDPHSPENGGAETDRETSSSP